MSKKLFSHTAIYGLAPQVSKIAQFFVLPIITKDLSEIDFGVAGIMTAYTSSISVLAILGLRIVLVNSFFKSPSQFKWAWRQLYGFLILWNFIYASLLGTLIYFIVPSEAAENRLLIMILNVAPLVIFGPVGNIGSTFYQLKQKPFQIGVRTAIFGVLGVILNLYFISDLKLGYMGWFWSSFITVILTNLSYWYAVNISLRLKPIFNFKWRLIKNSLKVSLPTVPHYYSGYLLNSSDKMVMDLVDIQTNDIGKYNAAYTVGNIVQQLGVAAGLAIGPILTQEFKKKNDLAARNYVFLLQGFFLIFTFVLSIWLKEIFHFLIKNENLSQMYSLGIIIVMSYNYRPMYFGSNAKLMFEEKTNIIWKVTFVAGLINVVLNLILLPIYGFEVSAYTTFISLMFMGYAGYYLPVFKKINRINFYPLRWLSLTCLLSFMAYFMVELNFGYKILITLLGLGIFFIVLQKFRLSIYESK
jgi:O-antigen/teichoic acid export membrane protein